MRLQVLFVVFTVGMLPAVLLSTILPGTYQTQAISGRVGELQEKSNIISNLLVTSGYFSSSLEGLDFTDTDAEIYQVAEAFHGRIVIANRDLKIRKDTYGLEEGKTIISEQAINCVKGSASKYIDNTNAYVELVNPIINPESKQVIGIIIMSFSTKNVFSIYDALSQKAVVLLLAVSIVVGIVAYIYAMLVTRPYARVASVIDHATEGYLDEQVDIHGFTEVQRISDSFNQLLERLKLLEESRQEFVSNVSHELKTPITSMKVLSDSLVGQEDVPVELYREFMEDIAEEIDREDKIINDLLSLVKLDRTAGELNISQVDINGLVEQILKRLRPIAAQRNIELVYESFRPVTAEVDEVKLSLAINNLIENAIKYNFDDGWVRVSLNADHKFFYVKVADSGVGIPEEMQNKIFERFYRVDKAHSRETGGTGLGLSITRNAILMHRGAIKVYSKEKEGSTFTIRIPLNFIA